ncbi:uncharacterized protein LOC119769417 [Culex quinquefasciatus]|uniref:uncharacterized protein LOC119769417 n=1 Tax=Culex quinquefasciatus TaxID=7176 RepID=UPI0018E36386|nr:uncharacterized protein LOC119769417 [Culex quinquefasciatus]
MNQPRRFHPVGSICGGFAAVVVTIGAIVKYDDAVRSPVLVALLIMWLMFSILLIAGIKKKNPSYLLASRMLLIAFSWISLTVIIGIMVQVVGNHKNHKFGLKVRLLLAFLVNCSFGGIFALSLWIVNVVIAYIVDLQPKPLSQQPLMLKNEVVFPQRKY